MFNIMPYNQVRSKFIYRIINRFKLIFKPIDLLKRTIEKFKSLYNNKLNWRPYAAKDIIINFIGKVKALFSYLIKKKPEETAPEGFLGININNGIITLVHIIVNNASNVIVKSYGVFDISSSNEVGNKNNSNPTQNIIAKYIKDHQLQKIASTYVLADQQYTLSPIELPPKFDKVAKEKIILLGVKDYINYPIEDAILESFEISIPRTRDNAKLAYAVAMRAKLSEEIGNLINGAGAKLEYIDINELSIRNIALFYEELQKCCLLLKLAESNSNILLLNNKELLMVRNTKLAIKKLDNFDPNNNNNPEDQTKLAENLISEIQRSLDYAHSIFQELEFNSINILPCNINLDLFIPWVAEQLGLPVNKIDLTNKIKFEQNISLKEQAQCLSALGGSLRILES